LDETLRSIEAGKFDIDEFLQAEEDDEMGLGLDLEGGEGPSMSAGGRGAGRGRGSMAGRSAGRGRADPAPAKKGLKGAKSRKSEEEEEEEDEEDDLALALGGLTERDDDLMMDVVGLDEEADEVDDDEEDEEDETEVKPTPKVAVKKTLAARDTPADPVKAGKDVDTPLVIDGIELDRGELGAGVEPPPLEEFKRLMESLGPESMFSDDYAEFTAELSAPQTFPDVEYEYGDMTEEEKVWMPVIYEGGKSVRPDPDPLSKDTFEWWLKHEQGPADWRVQVVSGVTNSSKNTTALEIVDRVYAHIQAGLTPEETERVNFQIICYTRPNGNSYEPIDDIIQMWCEGYNTYHLVDGFAMKEAWGSIMPHIMLSEKNLDAILDQVRWALAEDTFEGALLTPRLRRLRFRGGAQEMTTGFNTEELDSEFSVVSVR
jgi:hypothetical protein